MPRPPDPQLEGRILKAAQRLFLKGGEKNLSMRAIARAARTNTPALYRRFRDKKQILQALVERTQQDLFAVLYPCASVQEACQTVLEFALTHAHEWQLINAGIFSKVNLSRTNVEFMKERSAQWLGGAPEDHTALVLTAWALAHGAATLIISKAVPSSLESSLRVAVLEAVELLVQNAATK